MNQFTSPILIIEELKWHDELRVTYERPTPIHLSSVPIETDKVEACLQTAHDKS